MGDFVSQGKGKVLDEIYVPLYPDPKDFERVIARIKKTSPDVIFSTVVGSGTAQLHDAYRAAGFDPKRMPIASLTTSEAEVAEMGAEAAEGHITAAPFFETLSTPAARHFVASFKKKFGNDAPVTAAAEAAYFQMHLAMGALARSGSDDPEQVLSEIGIPNSTRRKGGCGSTGEQSYLPLAADCPAGSKSQVPDGLESGRADQA